MDLEGLAVVFGLVLAAILALAVVGYCAYWVNRSEVDGPSLFIGAVVAGIGLACYAGWLVPDRWSPILVGYGGTLICLSVAMHQPSSRAAVRPLIRLAIYAGFVGASLGLFGAHPRRMYVVALVFTAYLYTVETWIAAPFIGGFYVLEAVAGWRRFIPLQHPNITLVFGALLVLLGAVPRRVQARTLKVVAWSVIGAVIATDLATSGWSGQAAGATSAVAWIALAMIREASEGVGGPAQPVV
jgi:hypothetical protein